MDLRDTLQRVYLFRGADDADIDALAAIAEAQTHPAGTFIFKTEATTPMPSSPW